MKVIIVTPDDFVVLRGFENINNGEYRIDNASKASINTVSLRLMLASRMKSK